MKKPTFASLKRKLDAVFSQYIRLKDAAQGYAVCVTCHDVKMWKQLQCGHYVSRIYLATRWNEKNAAVQCVTCNVLRRGNYAEYTAYMLRKYGAGVIDELLALKRKPVKLTVGDLQDLLAEFKNKIARLGAL